MAIVCTIDETGIHAPTLADIQSFLVAQYHGIYGDDAYLAPDSQDGNWIGILATAIHDANAMTVAAYNAFSPSTAQGVGLARVVKINGISKHSPTRSTADLLIGGTVGTTISEGYATDDSGTIWDLPEEVVIPVAGQITVSATCRVEGATTAPPNSITNIGTPTRGWQTVTNLMAAVPGLPIEKDAALRRRQSRSVALPALSLLEGITGAVANISGVSQVNAYENQEPGEDENGVPGHAISMVVEGGDANAIAQAIAVKKAPGTKTWGDTLVVVPDAYGIPRDIRFYRPSIVQIGVVIQLLPFDGFTSATDAAIRAAVVASISDLKAGDDVILSRLYGPANSAGSTYNITSILIGRLGSPVLAQDVPMLFYENARANGANVAIQVLR